MKHNISKLIGSSVEAKDGEIGIARNFLFDDRSWKVRYLLVDVGSWHKRREVILPIASVEQSDSMTHTIHVNCTREQVSQSPAMDTKKPVSRQQEIAMHEYYNVVDYWIDSGFDIDSSMLPGADYAAGPSEDPHLRSVVGLSNYAVWATDAGIGSLSGFIVDGLDWQIGFLDVNTGDWLHNRSVLVPTSWVESISWASRKVKLHHTRAGA